MNNLIKHDDSLNDNMNIDKIFSSLYLTTNQAGLSYKSWESVIGTNVEIENLFNDKNIVSMKIPQPGYSNTTLDVKYTGKLDDFKKLISSNNVTKVLGCVEKKVIEDILSSNINSGDRYIYIIIHNSIDGNYTIFQVTPNGEKFSIPLESDIKNVDDFKEINLKKIERII